MIWIAPSDKGTDRAAGVEAFGHFADPATIRAPEDFKAQGASQFNDYNE